MAMAEVRGLTLVIAIAMAAGLGTGPAAGQGLDLGGLGDVRIPALDLGLVSVRVSGLVGGRVTLTDDELVRQDGGFGRFRHGSRSGERTVDAQISTFALVRDVDVANRIGLLLHSQHQPEFEDSFGLIEGYVYARQPIGDRWTASFEGGALFPDVSRENTGIGWTNTYTLSNTPGFTWIGEEVRPIGPRVGGSYFGDTFAATVKGGVFFGNDVSGAALPFGGFAINDLITPLGGEVDFRDDPPFPPSLEPFEEFDGRPGYQALVEFDLYEFGGISLLWWDNQGDLDASAPGAVVWDTRFFAASAQIQLPGGVSFLPSAMVGQTENPILGTEFRTVSGLVSRDFGRARLSARFDWFEQDDIRTDPPNPLSEDGFALLAAARYTLAPSHEVIAEAIYAQADNETDATGEPLETNEGIVQVEYRLRF